MCLVKVSRCVNTCLPVCSQGIEPWYQLPAEVDASRSAAASETGLGLTCDRSDLTEFPTLEEGALPSAEASRRRFPGDPAHSLLLSMFKVALCLTTKQLAF